VGKNIRLRLRDKQDLDFFVEFWNRLDCYGEYESIQPQMSKTEAQKRIENPTSTDVQWTWFVIERKDGTKIASSYIIRSSHPTESKSVMH